MVLLSVRLGESDCEEIGTGVLRQPANTLSSGAFTVLGLWLVRRALQTRSSEMALEVAYGCALAGVGIGSIAFHGPMPPGARWLHDVTIATVPAIVAARNLGAFSNWPVRRVLVAAALIIGIVGTATAVAAGVGIALTGVVGGTAVITEIVLVRRGRRRLSPRMTRLLILTVALLAGAGVINLLGRTDGPLCDPDSVVQGHGAWHLLTAGGLMLYGYAAFPGPAGVASTAPR
jgi:hypothetical protein